MSDDLEVSREDYDPVNVEEHRVPPFTVPELEPVTLPPDREAIADPAPVIANVPPEARPPAEPVVSGRMEDRPHFLRNVDGVELCGQDGEPWPCTEYLRTMAQVEATLPGYSGSSMQVGAPTGVELVPLVEAAAAAGLFPEELRARMEAPDRRYR